MIGLQLRVEGDGELAEVGKRVVATSTKLVANIAWRVLVVQHQRVTNACTQDCANLALGAAFGENSRGARQGL